MPAVPKRLIVAAVLVLAVLLGVGLVLLARPASESRSAAALVDRVPAVWSKFDERGARSLYDEHAVIRLEDGEIVTGIDAIVEQVLAVPITAEGKAFPFSWHVSPERVSGVTVHGEFAKARFTIGRPEGGRETIVSRFQIRNGEIIRQWDSRVEGA